MKKLAKLFTMLFVAGMAAMPALAQGDAAAKPPEHVAVGIVFRSEERRVGKECQ